jgi:cytochrome c oxidase assembly protein subunit 15
LILLGLLAVQREAYLGRTLALPWAIRRAAQVTLAILMAQIALGGWVSTNYAVLACSGFPSCNGQWWPAADWRQGFTVLRHLGHTAEGDLLPFSALVAIHWAHRLFAVVAAGVLVALSVALWRAGGDLQRTWGRALLLLTGLQLATGLSNVVLQWPIVAALLHSAGAAALVLVLVLMLARSATRATASRPAVVAAGLA